MKTVTTITTKTKKIHQLTVVELTVIFLVISSVLWIFFPVQYAAIPMYLHFFLIISAMVVGEIRMKKAVRAAEKRYNVLKVTGMLNKKGKVPIQKRLRFAKLQKDREAIGPTDLNVVK